MSRRKKQHDIPIGAAIAAGEIAHEQQPWPAGFRTGFPTISTQLVRRSALSATPADRHPDETIEIFAPAAAACSNRLSFSISRRVRQSPAFPVVAAIRRRQRMCSGSSMSNINLGWPSTPAKWAKSMRKAKTASIFPVAMPRPFDEFPADRIPESFAARSRADHRPAILFSTQQFAAAMRAALNRMEIPQEYLPSASNIAIRSSATSANAAQKKISAQ